jgi:glucose dehydrogenase
MARVIEADVCIIGSGISAAMVAEKLAAERDARIVVVEAGEESTRMRERSARRQRFLAYGENPWPDDHLDGHAVGGMQSRSMQLGGMAMHWGGVTPRFSPEDFRVRSLYGVGDDWPLTYEELDPYYQEAEERIGVAGEQGPAALDPRARPYPMPPLPLSYNLERLREWGAKADVPFWSQPSAKNTIAYAGRPVCCRNDTCSPVCPIGAKYSPDFTWDALRASGRVELLTRTMVRRLVLESGSDRVDHAVARDRDRPDEPVELRARTFVVAGGYVWSPHLLLLSASDRFPQGLANRHGLVGKYLAGHRSVGAFVRLPVRLYPGINSQHSLVTTKFMRPGPQSRYLRHDLRAWESAVGSEPRLRDDAGALLLGDEALEDWRRRAERGTARVRAYYDVLPARNSELTLDPARRDPWGDPLPALAFRDGDASLALREHSESSIRRLFETMARAGDGEILSMQVDDCKDHPAGGCRMGASPETGVVDRHGRAWDHENLFVVGAPTCVTAGCANGTLTFAALSLLAAEEIGREFPARGAPPPAA